MSAEYPSPNQHSMVNGADSTNSTQTNLKIQDDLSSGHPKQEHSVPEDGFKSLIQGREEQRKRLFQWVILGAGVFSLFFLALSGYFVYKMIDFVGGGGSENIGEALKSAGSLWHILLILVAPPTAVITLMVRSISFMSNERDLSQSDKKSDEGLSSAPFLNLLTELGKALIDLIKSKTGK